MSKHNFIIVEKIPPMQVAFFESHLPETDITNVIDIGTLFDLFSASAQATHQRETGIESTQEAVDKWMGPTRFHLPPTIRWICRLDLSDGKSSRDSLEVWMAASDRVKLGKYENIRDWAGGCFASLESGFQKTIFESWQELWHLLNQHDLTYINQTVYVENFQATNHGGWDQYRIMVEIDENVMVTRNCKL